MLKLTRDKKSPYWYVRGTVAGVRIYESTKTADKKQADQYRRKREAEVYDEVALGKQRPSTFADAVTAYLEHGKAGKYLGPLLEHFKETPLPKIGQNEIDAAANALYPRGKASTLNRQVYGPVIAVMRHAAFARLPGASLPVVKMRKVQKPVVTPADDEHIAKLLPHCSEGLRALILLMTYTGLRTGEALRVKEEDVKDGYVAINRTKNGEPRMVPAPSGYRWPSGGFGYQSTQGVGRALRKAHERAGLPYRDGHELGRHAFAARWLRNGGSLKSLKEAGGWQKLAIVDGIYGHLEQTHVHEFMRKLSEKK